VFGQANRTLNSPDSSGGASRGRRRCPRPPRRGRAHQPQPFTPAAGSSLCGSARFGGLRCPWTPTAPTSPYQSPPPQSLPVPGCAVKIQQHRMRPRVLELLCPRHLKKPRTREQPPNAITSLSPRAPACRRRSISLSCGQAPCLSFQRPSVRPCMAGGCCPAFGLLTPLSPCPGASMVAWLRPSCVIDVCGVCLAQGFSRAPTFSLPGRAGHL